MEEERIIEKNHVVGKIFLILGILLLIGGVGYFYYVKIYNNPQNIFNKISSLNFNKKLIANDLFDDNKPFKALGNIDIKMTNDSEEAKEIVDFINKLALQYEFEVDEKKELFNGSIHTKHDDKELSDINLYSENKKVYVYLKNIFDNYIEIPLDGYEKKNEELERINYLKIINSLVKSLDGAFEESDFKRESITVSFNDNDVKAYKNYLTIDKNNGKRIFLHIINNLLNDKDFLDEWTKVINKDAKKYLDDLKKEIEEDKLYFKSITCALYSKKLTNSIFKFEINYVGNSDETFIIENTSDKDISIKINDDGNKVDAKLTMINEKSYVFNFIVEEKNIGKIEVTINLSVDNIKEVSKVSVKDAKKYDELTEEDFNKIMSNLSKNEALVGIFGSENLNDV